MAFGTHRQENWSNILFSYVSKSKAVRRLVAFCACSKQDPTTEEGDSGCACLGFFLFVTINIITDYYPHYHQLNRTKYVLDSFIKRLCYVTT